jgi:uroporphyrinogen-III synthase
VAGDALARLRATPVVAASERLGDLAREHGLQVAAVASSARPSAMLAACVGAAAKP